MPQPIQMAISSLPPLASSELDPNKPAEVDEAGKQDDDDDAAFIVDAVEV
jgi:hypothetical protein